MNYRHHYHAGNFADVMKHVLVTALVQALQKKEKGFLYVDTHAGRGSYDLERAAAGDSLARKPEWPDGLGRVAAAAGGPTEVEAYRELVKRFDREAGNLTPTPRFYPGSPWLVRMLARPQDRMALCELQPAEAGALRAEFSGRTGTAVYERDGYEALRALLPPPERRALVLIDPPFEAQDEFARIGTALAETLRRLPGAVVAVWYPLTGRARVDEFAETVRALQPPPTLTAELEIAGERSLLKMRGCGLLTLNPPWGFDATARTALDYLAGVLEQEPGGGRGRVQWVVPER